MWSRKSNKAANAATAPVAAKPTRAEKRAAKLAAKQATAAAPAGKQTPAAKRAAKQAGKAKAASATAYRRPEADLYTVLLTLALVAISLAILFLCLEMNLYNFEFKGGPTPAMITAWPAVQAGLFTAAL